MRYHYQLLGFLLLAGSSFAQSKIPTAKIGSSVVWQLPSQFMTTAHAACDHSSSSSSNECMIAQMEKAGAPAVAVQFTRDRSKQNHGEFGIMTGFQDEGSVAFTWIT